MQVNFSFGKLYVPISGARSLKLSREQPCVREGLFLTYRAGEEMGRKVAWDRNLKDLISKLRKKVRVNRKKLSTQARRIEAH